MTDVKEILHKKRLRQLRTKFVLIAAKRGHDFKSKYWSFFLTNEKIELFLMLMFLYISGLKKFKRNRSFEADSHNHSVVTRWC